MISVCIPTYNGEKYIKRQLETILSQLTEKDEVIISDDSSSDKTIELINSFNDRRIKILSGNSFHSPIYNLENALRQAKGDIIFLSDQDDEWCSDKVRICLDKLNESDLVVHDAVVVDGSNNIISESFFSLNKSKKGKYYNLIKNGYIGCCMAFNRKVLEYALPFPGNLPMHDLWIGNVAAFKCNRVLFIKDKLIMYKRHGNNTSNAGEKSKRKIFKRIQDRIIILKALFLIKKK